MRKLKLNYSIFLLIFLLFTINSIAQTKYLVEDYWVEKYGKEAGLPEASIRGITQDTKGFIWLTTPNSLVRYDGYEFKTYYPKEAFPKLTFRFKSALIVDSAGNIWASTSTSRVLKFDPLLEQFTYMDLGGMMNVPFAEFINTLEEGADGSIWVGTLKGLNRIVKEADEYKIQQFFSTTYSSDLKQIIAEKLPQAPSFAKLSQVPAVGLKETTFEIREPKKMIVLCRGEYQNIWADFGWIEAEQGNKIWEIEETKSIHSGGATKNQVQIDIIDLPIGKYRMKYQSNGLMGMLGYSVGYPDRSNSGIWLYEATPELSDSIEIGLKQFLSNQTLLNDEVRALYPRDTNSFWAITNLGLEILDISKVKEGVIKSERIDLPANFVLHSQFLPLGQHQFLLQGNLYHPEKPTGFKSTNASVHYNAQTQKMQLQDNGIYGSAAYKSNFLKDKNGSYWLATINAGLFLSKKPATFPDFRPIDIQDAQNIEGGLNRRRSFNVIYEDATGFLWLGGNGLYKVNLAKTPIQYKPLKVTTLHQQPVKIKELVEDVQGNIWFSTANAGLFQYDITQETIKHYPAKNLEQASTSLYKGKEGYLIIEDAQGIKRYYPSQPDFEPFPITVPDSVQIVGVDNFGQYMGEFKSVVNGPRFRKSKLYVVEEGVFKGIQFDSTFKDDFPAFGYVHLGKKNNIWIASRKGGIDLYHWDAQLKQETFVQNFLAATPVASFFEDEEGILWAGTSYDGLIRLDPQKNTYKKYTLADGLPSNSVYNLLEVDNKIWMVTDLGLACLDKAQENILVSEDLNNYIKQHIQPSNFLQQYGASRFKNKMIKTKSNQLVLAAAAGFLLFDPQSIQLDTFPPKLHVVQLKVGGKPLTVSNQALQKGLSFNHNENDLDIFYLGLHFDKPTKNQYAYQLKGANDDWVEAGTEKIARYSNLAPGTYKFYLKASNADGIWSAAQEIFSFRIHPPWWQTWWAYLVYSLLLIGLLYYWYRSLQQKLKKEQAHNQELQSLNHELKDINIANQRFVPNEFLQILGKKSIKDLKLGDQTHTKMTVLFSDIRSYTTLSENMTPEENFKFINTYLGRIGSIIKAHGGFISSYLGDGFMALFANEPQNAIAATIAMQKELEVYNQERRAAGKRALRTGMGLNTGDLMLGVIGDEHRYESTVISDAVNTASRMEGLTKVFGAAIILSERTMAGLHVSDTSKVSDTLENRPQNVSDTLKVSDTFAYRYLGKVKVKGKDKALKIYDLYEGETVAIRQLKAQTHLQFEEGISHYYKRKFGKAAECFKQVLAVNEGDKAAQYYLDKSVGYIVNGVSEEWSGIEEMIIK